MARDTSNRVSKRKLRIPAPSITKKQGELTSATVRVLSEVTTLFGIWLVRQGLRMRSEQYLVVAETREDAEQFCRHYSTPLYCRQNLNHSLGLKVGQKRVNRVNYDKDHLLIKGIDFDRRETGRTNQSPLWYLVIAPIPVARKLGALIEEVNKDEN